MVETTGSDVVDAPPGAGVGENRQAKRGFNFRRGMEAAVEGSGEEG